MQNQEQQPASGPVNGGQTEWLSAYLYYAGATETFLTAAVRPFVERVLAEGWADGFFFIRYPERGPHVRLRFRGDAQTLRDTLKPALDVHFNDYFRRNPSRRHEPEWVATLPPAQQWYPNHSVQYIPYEPEIQRYGGPLGIRVAERHFEASSRAVLSLLSEPTGWNYNRAMGAAIQLQLGFAHAAGMSQAEATVFFSRTFENWLPRTYGLPVDAAPSEEVESRRRHVLDAFRTAFEGQSNHLLALMHTIWEALDEGQEFEQDWFNAWLSSVREVAGQLGRLQEEGNLTAPFVHPAARDTPSARDIRWSIYESYVHMTNNRLGIQNRDEGYLGYLLKEGFVAISC